MMNPRKRPALALLIALWLGACSTVQLRADYKPGTPFQQFHTYAWLPDVGETDPDPRAGDPLVSERVTRAIETELARRGYEQVESQPDFQVAFSFSVRNGIDVHAEPVVYGHYGQYGYGGAYGLGYSGAITTVQFREGTLQIDFVDPEVNGLVWRGSGISRLRDNPSPQESEKRINAIVKKILAQFPPE